VTRTERCGRPCRDGHACRAISAKGGRGCALHYQPREENTVNATERHAALIDAGWRCRLDGLWKPPPDWHDHRAYRPAAAWAEHTSRDNPDRLPND
jgi:hypothetical protein